MKNLILPAAMLFSMMSCSEKMNNGISQESESNHFNAVATSNDMTKSIKKQLPTIGILIFEGFLTNEVVAPMDVFTKKNAQGEQLFNIVLIAKENKLYESEEGLKVLPDFTIEQTPNLDVLVIPSSYHPEKQTKDQVLIDFIQAQNKTTDYIASHCAGAFLLGESGVANNKKIVTYVTGGKSLQKDYPELKVMDDSKVAVMEDGKIFSSNGSLVSYLGSLELLEKLTNTDHRKAVESELLLDRLVAETAKKLK